MDDRLLCSLARHVSVFIRELGAQRGNVYDLAIPRAWPRETLEAYVRDSHPGAQVAILGWSDALWWTPNPAAFSDFKRGVRADV